MSTVGRFLFSKLVLPAIAVQAKESDIEENRRENAQQPHGLSLPPTAPAVLSPTNHGNLDIGPAEAAPANASRKTVSGRGASVAAGDDALLSELQAFRAWQRSRGVGPQRQSWRQGLHSPRDALYTPSNAAVGRSEQLQAGGATLRAHSHPSSGGGGSTNIIVINQSKEMQPSNLTATNEPTNMDRRANDDISVQKFNTAADLTTTASNVYPAVISEEQEDRALKLDINDGDAVQQDRAAAQDRPPTPHSLNTVEEIKIVPTIVDGRRVDKFETQLVTYSDDQLYMAASQFYHRLLAEFLGTWALTFFIAGFNIEASLHHIDQMGVAIGSGLVFVFLIYSLGQVSGAHFNPIVTFAFVLRGMFPFLWLPFYWLVQFVGAIVAAAMLLGFYGSTVGDAGANAVPAAYSQEAGFWMETVLSFVLVFTILSMASRSKIVGPHAALAIGAVIAFDVMLAGSYSGASMNPWRSISISIVFPVTFYSIWVYFAGPFLGATFAVIVVFLLAGRPRQDELTAGIGATIAVAIGNSIARSSETDDKSS